MNIELTDTQRRFLLGCIMSSAKESYPFFDYRLKGEYKYFDDLAIELAKLLGASEFDLECIERGI